MTRILGTLALAAACLAGTQAYASDVIPKAQGTAARLLEEAQGYKSRVVAQAEGDSQRFLSVYREYQKAPAVTRGRLYIDTMREVYSNVSKVLVDTRSSSPMLYLPLDKLIQQSGAGAQAPATATALPCSRSCAPAARSWTATVASSWIISRPLRSTFRAKI